MRSDKATVQRLPISEANMRPFSRHLSSASSISPSWRFRWLLIRKRLPSRRLGRWLTGGRRPKVTVLGLLSSHPLRLASSCSKSPWYSARTSLPSSQSM
jgi:hypothetical protein